MDSDVAGPTSINRRTGIELLFTARPYRDSGQVTPSVTGSARGQKRRPLVPTPCALSHNPPSPAERP